MKIFITALLAFSCLSVLGRPVYLHIKPHNRGSSNITIEETPITDEVIEEASEDTPVELEKTPNLNITLRYMDGTVKEISIPYGEIKSFTIN